MYGNKHLTQEQPLISIYNNEQALRICSDIRCYQNFTYSGVGFSTHTTRSNAHEMEQNEIHDGI